MNAGYLNFLGDSINERSLWVAAVLVGLESMPKDDGREGRAAWAINDANKIVEAYEKRFVPKG